MKAALTLLFLAFCASVVSGENANETWVQITPSWNVTQLQIDQFVSLLPRLEEDTWTWHWGTEENTVRWDKQGLVDQGELDWYNQQSAGMAAGGGFYVSLSQTDSKSFGVFPSGILLPKGALRYPSTNYTLMSQISKVLGKYSLRKEEKTALGRIVPFYDLYSSTWIVIHNATLLQKVTLAFRVAEFKPAFGSPNMEFNLKAGGIFPAMEQLVNFTPSSAPYIAEMRRHWSLLDFLGPLQANRMRLEYGKNLWKKIDIQKFDRFHKTVDEATRDLYFGSNDVFRNIGFNDAFSSKESQLKQVFSTLWKSLNENGTMWREEASSNEGDASIKYYTIVDGEYADLQASPYLNLEVIEKNSANGTLIVRIEHPSVLNVKKFMHILSPELMRNISYYSIAKLQQNGPLRRILNAKIMEELFEDSFNLIYDQSCRSLAFSQFLQNWGRIQPFSKDNYLLRKLFERIATVALLKDTTSNCAMEVIPEISILVPSYFRYRAQMEQISTFNFKIYGFVAASRTAFNPSVEVDYFAGWSNFSRNYITYNFNQVLSFDTKALQMIKERRIVDLFDRDLPEWRFVISQKLDIQLTPTWMTSQAQFSQFIQASPKVTNNSQNYFTWMQVPFIQFGSSGEIKNISYPSSDVPISLNTEPSQFTQYSALLTLPLVTNIKEGAVRYQRYNQVAQNMLTSTFQINLYEFDISKIQKYIPLVEDQFGTLLVSDVSLIINPRVAYGDQNLNFTLSATRQMFENGVINPGGIWKTLFGFVKNVMGSAIADKMARHWNLVDFIGALQANRLRIQYGDRLWDHIDQKKFDRYHLTLTKMIQDSINGTGFKFNDLGRITIHSMDKEWVDRIIDVFFQSIWGNLTGSHGKMFREDEIWNNGKGKNHTFTIINRQYTDLISSPYLEVEVVERNDTDGSMKVRFQHPHVYNVTKLFNFNLISKELYSNITSYSKSELEDDDELRGHLNSLLMRELLSGLLMTIGVQQSGSQNVFRFYQNLERVSPFSSDNHSIRKIFEKILFFEIGSNTNSFIDYLPGTTTLMPYTVSFYGGYYGSSSFNNAVRNEGMDSMIQNFYRKKPIDYFTGWDSLKTFYITTSSFTATFNATTMELLEREEYLEFLDICAPTWRNRI